MVRPADRSRRVSVTFFFLKFQNRRAVAGPSAHGLPESTTDIRRAPEKFSLARVNRLGEARIDDGELEAFVTSCCAALRAMVFIGPRPNSATFFFPLVEKFWTTCALPIFEQLRLVFDRHAFRRAAWITG